MQCAYTTGTSRANKSASNPIAMDTIKKYIGQASKPTEADFFKRFWEESFTYIKTVVDVVHEPVLILDKELRVIAANESFYQTFKVDLKDTEGKIVYELGDGQWNIPALRKLLEDILPKNSFFKGFQVAHEFPSIGRKVMVLNGRQIYIKDSTAAQEFPPIILLAIEDVTEMMVVAETLSSQANQIEAKLMERSQKLEAHIGELQNEIDELKKRS